MSIFSDFFEHKSVDDTHHTVTVKSGDSLWKIAQAVTGDGNRWKELAEANPDKEWSDDYVIQPGEELKVPNSWVS